MRINITTKGGNPMSKSRRFDNRHMVLQKGEYQKANGMYEYRWTDAYGKRHSVYAADLDELRIKEQKVELPIAFVHLGSA